MYVSYLDSCFICIELKLDFNINTKCARARFSADPLAFAKSFPLQDKCLEIK